MCRGLGRSGGADESIAEFNFKLSVDFNTSPLPPDKKPITTANHQQSENYNKYFLFISKSLSLPASKSNMPYVLVTRTWIFAIPSEINYNGRKLYFDS